MSRPIKLAILSGLLCGLSFPPFNFSYLIWICLVPAFLFSSKKNNPLLIEGFFMGLAANLIIFFWLWKTFDAASVNFPTTLLAWIALSSVLSLYFMIFYFSVNKFSQKKYYPLFGASLWVGLNLIQTHILTGFPWAYFANTMVSFKSLIQISSVFGSEGITFLIVFINLSLVLVFKEIISKEKSKNWINLAVGFVVILGIVLWGAGRINSAKKVSGPILKVALLQGNIDQYQKWDDSYEKMIRTVYENLSKDVSKSQPDLIIWPESSIPGWYPNEKFYRDWVAGVVQRSSASHIIGAVNSSNGMEFNSAFHLNEKGRILSQYNKKHLVPFGEYVPFVGILGKVVPYLGSLGIFDAGKKLVLFKQGNLSIAPNVCYEAIFPSLVRKSVLLGADLIVNLTNDGWYLDTGAPEQHYVHNVFRAVELGRPVLRAANTGISAVIDAWGNEVLKTDLLDRRFAFAEFAVTKPESETLYLKFGSWFSWFCGFLALVMGYFGWKKSSTN